MGPLRRQVLRLYVPKGAERITVEALNSAGDITHMYLSYSQWAAVNFTKGSLTADFGSFEYLVCYLPFLYPLCLQNPLMPPQSVQSDAAWTAWLSFEFCPAMA
jgi:hypothetical protein